MVTGANKGIGLETARQLAFQGVTVVLIARNEKRGMEAASKLHESGLPNVVFHLLDVLDQASILNLAKFIQEKFGRLDILVFVLLIWETHEIINIKISTLFVILNLRSKRKGWNLWEYSQRYVKRQNPILPHLGKG